MKTLAEAMDSLEATAMRVKDERDRLRTEKARLVEALRFLVAPTQVDPKDATPAHVDAVLNREAHARALLRELGEL